MRGCSPSQGVAFDERRRPRQRAALPAGGGTDRGPAALSPLPMATSLTEVARELDVSPATLRRWVARGHRAAARRPLDAGGARPGADRRPPARARALARRRSAGGAGAGRLAYGYLEDLFPAATAEHARSSEAAERDRARAGADPSASGRRRASRPPRSSELTDDDLAAAALHRPRCWTPGFPLVAFLQLVRVYGQALAQIADAEVKLFHLYVHEPLIRDGVAGPRDGRGDGGPGRASCCRSPRRSWTTSTSASCSTSSSRTSSATSSSRSTGRRRARARAGGDRLRRPRRLHAPDRGGGRGGGARHRRALRRGASRRRCPTTRA